MRRSAFARLATLEGVDSDADAEALRVVRDAMIAHPEYVAGTGRFDTVLMQASDGAIACKGGAEGIHGVAAIAARFRLRRQSARRCRTRARPVDDRGASRNWARSTSRSR